VSLGVVPVILAVNADIFIYPGITSPQYLIHKNSIFFFVTIWPSELLFFR